MQSLSTSEASTQSLPSLFEQAKSNPIVVTNGESTLGAIVSMEDFQIIHKANVEKLLASMDRLGEEIRKNCVEQGISLQELESQLDRHNL